MWQRITDVVYYPNERMVHTVCSIWFKNGVSILIKSLFVLVSIATLNIDTVRNTFRTGTTYNYQSLIVEISNEFLYLLHMLKIWIVVKLCKMIYASCIFFRVKEVNSNGGGVDH